MKERKDMAPFMKNVVFFALFANLFILVSADSRCADNSLSHSRQYKCTENCVCCADGECHPKTCFNIFCLQGKDCTNQRDKLWKHVCLGVTSPDEAVLWIPIVQLTKFAVTQNVFKRAIAPDEAVLSILIDGFHSDVIKL